MKRFLDVFISFFGLLFLSPILLYFMFLIYRQDKQSPLYIAVRVGKNEKMFNMTKIRSMIINADKTGVNSTSLSDKRITPIGQKIRKYKLDELTQLWNVLVGDMSLVGPRPNVLADTNLYTAKEKKILSIKPGITDFASIVFSDEGKILKDKEDPDRAYNQIIRPWKSRLAILYVEKQNFILDFQIVILTILSLFDRNKALEFLSKIVYKISSDEKLRNVCLRKKELEVINPPGYPSKDGN
jgi:lipopolysaccharide/colanic/teichoic acid biosynthesis glycosyltransferase